MNLLTLSEAIGLSESHTSRLVNQLYGMSFSEYINRIRIEKAVWLLDSGLSINDTMQQTGYTSLATFRRWFKNLQGMSPSEYLQKKKE